MVKLKLVPYSLELKEKPNEEERTVVSVNCLSINFDQLLESFLKDTKDNVIDKDNETVFACSAPKKDTDEPSIIYSTLGYGTYGYSGEIVDANTGKEIGTKKVNEAVKIRFYLVAQVFPQRTLLLLNKFRTRGVKTKFEKQLNKYLKEKTGRNIFARIRPLVSSGLTNAKEYGKVELIRKVKRKDVEGQILQEYDDAGNDEIKERRIFDWSKNPVASVAAWCKKVAENLEESQYVLIDNQQYTQAIVRVTMDSGSKKTIKLGSDCEYFESIPESFDGDFPELEEYYERAKEYFLYVRGKSPEWQN